MTKRTSGRTAGGNRRRVSGIATGPPPETLAYDPSSITAMNTGNTTGGVWTSPSFSPPGSAVIIITVENSFQPSGSICHPTLTVTDSLASHLTWALGPSYVIGNAAANFGTSMWTYWAAVGATAPGAMTVTASGATTLSGACSYVDGQVDVWTGAKTSNPFGATSTGDNTAQPWTVALTPHHKGSAIIGFVNNGNLNAVPVAGSGDFIYHSPTFASWQASVWSGTSGGFTPTPNLSPVTLDVNMGSSTVSSWVAYEVLAGP